MPHKRWKHLCPDSNSEVISGAQTCLDCGQQGVYAGWGYSMIEAMGAYQRFYRLKPMGPHRPLAHEILGPLVAVCSKCEGSGLVDLNSGEAWEFCKTCQGTGRLVACTAEQWQAARDKVLQAFPDSAVNDSS
jgi:hypothetical protein